MTETFVENYRDWNIYYLGFPQREEKPPPTNYRADCTYRTASIYATTLESARLQVDWAIAAEPPEGPTPEPPEPPEPPEGTNLPHACLIASVFGPTILNHAFPYLRMFRDRVMPRMIVNKYYAFSRFCLDR